jgi:hypothetical protein
MKAALVLARKGLRVHPCRPGDKIPLLKDWPARATTDPDTIKEWWRQWPDVNVAVATGPESGIAVLDVDGPEGERSLADLERQYSPLPDAYPMQWTGGGRGGWQAFFAYPAGRKVGNSAGRLGPKLDTRGDRGFVLVPPSRTSYAYAWGAERSIWHVPLPPMPAWMVDLLDPPEQPHNPWTPPNPTRGSAYAAAALKGALSRVATAANGQRNDQLNASAHSLFGLVATGELDREIVVRGLEQAAVAAGLVGIEIGRTIRSAAKAQGVAL